MKKRRQVRQSPIRSSFQSYSPLFDRASVFDSLLEMDYSNYLHIESKCTDVWAQPQHIAHRFLKKETRYTPDFLVFENDLEYVDEVKSAREANMPAFIAKAAYLASVYAEQGRIFRVITEEDIRVGSRTNNLRRLMTALHFDPPIEECRHLCEKSGLRAASISTFFSLLETLSMNPTFLARGLAHRLINTDFTRPWHTLQLTW